MEDTSYWLPLIWVGVLGVAVALYVVLDGFDLGIGILFPASPEEAHRDQMMNSVAPFWDGNETWLVLGGGGMLVAFPLVYSIIMPAVYLPVIIMLLALVLRGVAFEFRWVAKPNQLIWDVAFAGGSIVASFMQGVILGGILQGITVANGEFGGGAFDWLTPFSLLCGLGVVAGYALLAAGWLVMKTEGRVADHARAMIRPLLMLVGLAAAAVSIWTPLAHEEIATRWFSLPNLFWFMPVPILVLVCTWALLRAVANNAHHAPFVLTLVLIFLGYSGLGISLWPNVIPPSISIWDAAAPPQSQGFMLVGALFIIPFILMYTAWSYYVFRGKVRVEDGYH